MYHWSYKNNSTDSNTLEITGEIVIPRYLHINICCVTMFIFKQLMYDAHKKNSLGTKQWCIIELNSKERFIVTILGVRT